MTTSKLIVGGNLKDDAAAFVAAWRKAEGGASVRESVVAFESWEGLASVLTGERLRLLRYLHAHPQPSVSALARALGRPYRRVHGDVAALEAADLLTRKKGELCALANTILAEVRLAA